MNKTEWSPHPNAKKVENELQKSDISDVKQTRSPWFLTTEGKFGTLPGMQYHVNIIDCFKQELEMDHTPVGFEIDNLDEFLYKTGMIRIRPKLDRIDLTIGTPPNNFQLDQLEKLEDPNYKLTYEIQFSNVKFFKKGIGFSNLKKDLESIQKEL